MATDTVRRERRLYGTGHKKVTSIWTDRGLVYLSVVMDLFSRRIISSMIGRSG